jgi:hypothetical protein
VAAAYSDLQLVKALLELKVDVDGNPGFLGHKERISDRLVPILCACARPNDGSKVQIVRCLIEAGADVGAYGYASSGTWVWILDRASAIELAAESGCVETLLLLLNAGAKIEGPRRTNCGYGRVSKGTALDRAAARGRLHMVRLLLSLGAASQTPGNSGFDSSIEHAKVGRYWGVAQVLREHSKMSRPS